MVDFVGAVAAPGVAPGAGLAAPGVAAPGVGVAAAPPDDAPAAPEAVAPPATGVWVRAAVPPAAAGEVPPAAGVAAAAETAAELSLPGVAAVPRSAAGASEAPAVTPGAAPGAVITREAAFWMAEWSRRVPQAPTSGTAIMATSSLANGVFLDDMCPPRRRRGPERLSDRTLDLGPCRASTNSLHWSEYSHSKLPTAIRSRWQKSRPSTARPRRSCGERK